MLCLGAAIGLSLEDDSRHCKESHCRMNNDHRCVPIKASLDSYIIYIYIYIIIYSICIYIYILTNIYIYIFEMSLIFLTTAVFP